MCSNFILKKSSLELCEPLSLLFTNIFESGLFPKKWRCAVVVPVFKKGDASNCANYRPISLTCPPCKVMETIIHAHMYKFLQNHNLISKFQFGFRPKYSTEAQILTCLNSWTEISDTPGTQVDIAYIDFSKAFDSVSHPKLLLKLENFGFRGKILKFLENFLKNRSQQVKINNCVSNQLPVVSGVPQGSVLGPLLFIIYINDIVDVLEHATIKIYADDSKIYFRCRNDEDFEKLQHDIGNVQTWANKWQLTLSLPKCQILSVGYQPKIFDYTLGTHTFERVTHVKDLGIFISTDLKPAVHIQKITNAAFYKSYLIRRCFATKTADFLMKLFDTYILSRLHYASTTWSPWLHKDIIAVERVLRRYTKHIPELAGLSYEERLSRLGRISLEYMRLRNDLVYAFSVLNNFSILVPNEFFRLSNRFTRNSLLSISARRDVRKHFWSLRIVNVYNSLPIEVRNSCSKAVFKRKLSFCDITNFLKVFKF